MAFQRNGNEQQKHIPPQHIPNIYQQMQQQGTAFNPPQPGGYGVYRQQLPAHGKMQLNQNGAAPNGFASNRRPAFHPQPFQAQYFQAQPFQAQAFAAQAFHAQLFQSQAFQSQAFQSQAFQSQAFQPQINAQVHHGDPNIINRPGFHQAAAGEPLLGDDHGGFHEHQDEGPESAIRTKPWMYGDMNDLPLSGPRIKVPIDIQQSKGRFYAGSALYVIEREIQPGGDPRRMSDGVYLLKHPSGGLRVAKFLKVIDPDDMDRIKAEKEILERLAEMNSPHINYLHEAYWPKGAEHCTLILDHCDGGSLEGLIAQKRAQGRHFSEGFIWHTLQHMSSALSMTHNGIKNPLKKHMQMKPWDTIVHMDIKPGNVFVKHGRGLGLEDDEYPTIVLGDFGCAVRATDVARRKELLDGQPFGTPGFFPPEASGTSKHAGRWGRPTDIWQVGALLVCMCRLVDVPTLDMLVSPNPCGDMFGPELNKMVKTLLREDPAKRPMAVDVVEIIREMGRLKVRGRKVSKENTA